MSTYYTLHNVPNTEITVDNVTLVVGQLYEKKIKSPKNDDFILAFSKVEKQWRFDGYANIDMVEFAASQFEKMPDNLNISADDIEILKQVLLPVFTLAWKSEIINIQSRLRPSKDSAKELRKTETAATIKDIHNQLIAGTIDAEEFANLTQQAYIAGL